jgi:predicted dinucleotide-binding enzyme
MDRNWQNYGNFMPKRMTARAFMFVFVHVLNEWKKQIRTLVASDRLAAATVASNLVISLAGSLAKTFVTLRCAVGLGRRRARDRRFVRLWRLV